MRSGLLSLELVGVRVKNNKIIGALLTTSSSIYPFIYEGKGEAYVIKQVGDRKFIVPQKNVEIIRKDSLIILGGREYRQVAELPYVLRTLALSNYLSFKCENGKDEEFIVFSPFFPKDFIQSIRIHPVPLKKILCQGISIQA